MERTSQILKLEKKQIKIRNVSNESKGSDKDEQDYNEFKC